MPTFLYNTKKNDVTYIDQDEEVQRIDGCANQNQFIVGP
jgi:hypothetical protein